MEVTLTDRDTQLRPRHEWQDDHRRHILITPLYRGWYAWTQAFMTNGGSVCLEHLDKENAWYLTNVFTDPASRGQGVATMLIRRALKEAKRRGVKFVRLWTDRDTIPFYKPFGFRLTGENYNDYNRERIMYIMQVALECIDRNGRLKDTEILAREGYKDLENN